MAGTAFLGYLIDISFQTVPLWTVVGAVLGVISAGVHLFRIVGRMGLNNLPSRSDELWKSWFISTCCLGYGVSFIHWIGWGFFPQDEATAGPVALLIMFAAVTPCPDALLGQTTPNPFDSPAGGSLVKIVAICVMVLAVRRAQWPFADKNSFLIWLFVFVFTNFIVRLDCGSRERAFRGGIRWHCPR